MQFHFLATAALADQKSSQCKMGTTRRADAVQSVVRGNGENGGKWGETVVWIAHVHGNGKYNNKSKAK